jgi:threonine synthase
MTILADYPFDPLQDIIKKINSEDFIDFKKENNITSFNSINIARILAQVVYYFRAYTELLNN